MGDDNPHDSWYEDGQDHEYDYDRIERFVSHHAPEDELSDLSEDILDAHAEIQKHHHDQATRLLRIYAIGLGLILAAGGFVVQQVTATRFPSFEQVSLPRLVAAILLFVRFLVGIYTGVRATVRSAGTVELLTRVLTPDQISDDSRLSTYFGVLQYFGHVGETRRKNEDEFQITEGRESVRRAIEVDQLIERTKHPRDAKPKAVTERLVRARENEYVINYNVAQLSQVYGNIVRSLNEVTLGVVLIITGTNGLTLLSGT